MERKLSHISETLSLAILSGLVIIVAIAVAVVMFAPSNLEAVSAALTETAEEILAAVNTYPERSHLFLESTSTDSLAIITDSASVAISTGPFDGLRFDRIGYFDPLSADARTLYTDIGRFTLQVSSDGEAFGLTAYGPDDIILRWEGQVEDQPEE
ncbi:MAG TPA: hypothetical protein ENH10_00940 [Bacteroidetes bacterium]|nr:hypothetical protein BMS3Bbin04_01498 [bacterium BMS3Bbin04]HDO64585.1 hypothetical protein [Bacteroidota bacterium]HEX03710.1 hypothetical protein [Bacteroidota bacterium]